MPSVSKHSSEIKTSVTTGTSLIFPSFYRATYRTNKVVLHISDNLICSIDKELLGNVKRMCLFQEPLCFCVHKTMTYTGSWWGLILVRLYDSFWSCVIIIVSNLNQTVTAYLLNSFVPIRIGTASVSWLMTASKTTATGSVEETFYHSHHSVTDNISTLQ